MEEKKVGAGASAEEPAGGAALRECGGFALYLCTFPVGAGHRDTCHQRASALPASGRMAAGAHFHLAAGSCWCATAAGLQLPHLL